MNIQEIPTLPDDRNRLDRQEFFNRAATAIIAQGKPGWDGKISQCVYRAGSVACAIGQFIPDTVYTEAMEGSAPDEILKQVNPDLILIGDDHDFLSSLQEAHDEAAITDNFLDEYRARMSDIARDLGLSAEVLAC